MRIIAVLIVAVVLSGCGPTDEQLKTWQDASSQLTTEIATYQQELAVTTDPADRAGLEATLAELQRQAEIFDKALRAATDAGDIPWAIGETIVGMIAGIFPMAGIAIPIIRTLRKQRESIFKAVDAGGGVKNKVAAKESLKENPAAMAALDAWKAAEA